ncbi:hypothetical protein VTK26DRAFT_2171 [Humicola hyalothermophila]
MGFRKFKSDVSTAAEKIAASGITRVRSVTAGDSDGEVVVQYNHGSLPKDIRIQALAQNLDDYPDGNMFMLWTDDPDPPLPVVSAIKATQDYLFGMSVYEMVTELSTRLEKELTGAGDDGDDDEEGEEVSDPDDGDRDYDVAYDTDLPSDGDEFGLPSPTSRHSSLTTTTTLNSHQKALLQRIRRDLRQVKQAGYKVGFLDSFGQTSTSGYVSISIRIDKLALSNEAMEAWDVLPREYVVLLLRFSRPYDPLERVINQPATLTEIQFRIGKCKKYKPSLAQALGAFAESNRFRGTADGSGTEDWGRSEAVFEKLFISNSLDQYLNESFISLLKLRATRGTSWEDANEYLLAKTGLISDGQQSPSAPEKVSPPNEAVETDRVPEPHQVLVSDRLLEDGGDGSLPLIAMQFAMRYFVKCTEYCLRCHRRLGKGFEALRPYVCSNPLCLFQYMAMGLGPSVEHEILTEPYVVDLLVSFCYSAIQPYYSSHHASTTGFKLPIRDLPVGLRLRVPDVSNTTGGALRARTKANDTLLVFEGEDATTFAERLAPKGWVAFRELGQSLVSHARILEISSTAKSVTIQVMARSSANWVTANHAYSSNGHGTPIRDLTQNSPNDAVVDVFPYAADFDSLEDAEKGVAMRLILDTLPPILEIEEWLSSHPQSSIRCMDRISPAAASLLQWIVSSNRSCIFQVDRSRAVAARVRDPTRNDSADDSAGCTGTAGRGRNREHERIPGMDGWVQFRFAQGSPDKELRFNRALQEVAARKPIESHPTIFAWHGSNMANWHSIVRTGLDFKDIRSGRAFGNGVYFSPYCSTSLGYTGGGGHPWPNSDLKVCTCLSLNEIINAPDEFVSRSPHYVVAQLDWHQCRYIFVRTPETNPPTTRRANPPPPGSSSTPPSDVAVGQACHPQAEGLEVYGQDGKPLQIPLSAIPLRTVGPSPDVSPGSLKRTVPLPEESEDEDAADIAMLFTDDEFTDTPSPPGKKSASRGSSVDREAARESSGTGGSEAPNPSSFSIDLSLTDFVPGALDLSTLPRLAPPSFATDAAAKALSRELVRLQQLQSRTPLDQLGWYMSFDDDDAMANLFQWIVELHSFEPSLPLAQDMKRAGVTSVVLEFRFAGDFPFSPPFVRVVRPRFMPFAEGGGGHVTAGGAMCMELLTSSGWSPANSMESVILQVRMAICSLEPQPARLDRRMFGTGSGWARGGGGGQAVDWKVPVQQKYHDYSVGEAVEAYVRAAKAHGWTVPENLRATAFGV